MENGPEHPNLSPGGRKIAAVEVWMMFGSRDVWIMGLLCPELCLSGCTRNMQSGFCGCEELQTLLRGYESDKIHILVLIHLLTDFCML